MRTEERKAATRRGARRLRRVHGDVSSVNDHPPHKRHLKFGRAHPYRHLVDSNWLAQNMATPVQDHPSHMTIFDLTIRDEDLDEQEIEWLKTLTPEEVGTQPADTGADGDDENDNSEA